MPGQHLRINQEGCQAKEGGVFLFANRGLLSTFEHWED